MAAVSELACIYSALILHKDKVTVTEDKISALIKVAGASVESFWPGFFAKANVNIGSNAGPGGPAPTAGATPVGGPVPSTTAVRLRRRKWKKEEESKESGDKVGFGLFD